KTRGTPSFAGDTLMSLTPSGSRLRTCCHVTAMLALVLGNAWLQCVLGDLTTGYDGFGPDGVFYATMARDLPGGLKQDIWFERLQRILPSAVIYAAFQTVGLTDPTNAQIILAFRLLNALCLAAAVLVWHRVADVLGLRWPGRWFGFL